MMVSIIIIIIIIKIYDEKNGIRNYAIILLLFVGLVCIYTPPRNTTPFSRSESIDNGKKKIIAAAAAAAAKTTIIACDVSTPYDNVDVAEGTLRITIQNDNHDNNSSIHTQRKGSSAEAFVNLVDAKFYDSTYTFRVIKGFVVQWGFRGGTQSSDKNGDGDGDRTKFDAASKRIREADIFLIIKIIIGVDYCQMFVVQ
eukprot:CAMPEP_0170979766 /NCGR_PEP_ID=MMETSP0736-20130129/2021_1 /TAXON_ID=186038 /ORGANISM="Fragilariopsis kerguelensis, Strain L26-C5" /LENGTH=197 /DNA_ID=CAMNT_0011402451 /DNA_START=215 /DNA_END=808 /DNA_ORIENTATION=+